MKLVFVSDYDLEKNTDWMHDEGGKKVMYSICGECLKVNPATKEIEDARGYEALVADWLQEGKVRFTL